MLEQEQLRGHTSRGCREEVIQGTLVSTLKRSEICFMWKERTEEVMS